MQREEIAFVGTSDLAGHFRGKSFPLADLAARLDRGVGLAPSNIFISAFGPIQTTPFGTRGEVFLIPDTTTHVTMLSSQGGEDHFYVGNIETADRQPWSFCPRYVLRRALQRLEDETGLQLLATFEQEFTYSGAPEQPWQPYSLDAYRRQGGYGEALLAAMRRAGVIPDSFLAEYGPRQYEVTSVPAVGLRAADNAVITRELARAVAYGFGERVSFSPIPTPAGIGNGTHIHWSFLDRQDQPVLYDERRPWQLSQLGESFIAGIVRVLPALCAVTAPSIASYYRLRPDRWAPTCADAAPLDRGAALRICPVSGSDPQKRARQFNIEYRVADATASPYLALAMLIQAGLDGVRSESRIHAGQPRALPDSLAAALTQLERVPAAADWMGADLLEGYVAFKRAEIDSLENLGEMEICNRYAQVY